MRDPGDISEAEHAYWEGRAEQAGLAGGDYAASSASPWPLPLVLEKLAEAADILLDHRCYDGHGWELIAAARDEAKKLLGNRESMTNQEGAPPEEAQTVARLSEQIELAWGLIANAYGGDWDKANDEWREAVERWRDKFHAIIEDRSMHQPVFILFDGDKAVGALRAHDGNHGIHIASDPDAVIGEPSGERFRNVEVPNEDSLALLQFTSLESLDAVIGYMKEAREYFGQETEEQPTAPPPAL